MDFRFHKKEWASAPEERLPWALLYEDHLFSFWKDAIRCPPPTQAVPPAARGHLVLCSLAGPPLRLCQAPCPAPPCVHPQLEASGHPHRTPQSQGRTLQGARCFSDLSTTFASIGKKHISQDAPEPKLPTQIILRQYLCNYRSFRRLLRPPRKSGKSRPR